MGAISSRLCLDILVPNRNCWIAFITLSELTLTDDLLSACKASWELKKDD